MGNITAKKGTIKKATFTVSGNTLEEIQNDLFDKQIGGTDAIGDCSTPIKTPNITKFVETEVQKPKKAGTVEYIVTAEKGPKVEMTAKITLPKLKSDKNLSPKARKEWQRFIGALSAHEDQHVEGGWQVAQEIAAELSAMEGRGVGKNKDAAVKAAKADFVKQYKAAYGGNKVSVRINKAHAALDAKGNTFTLDINIE